MKMIISIFVVAGVVALIVGCGATPEPKAFAQQKQADLVIEEFRSFDEFEVTKPMQMKDGQFHFMTKEELDVLLPSLAIDRNTEYQFEETQEHRTTGRTVRGKPRPSTETLAQATSRGFTVRILCDTVIA